MFISGTSLPPDPVTESSLDETARPNRGHTFDLWDNGLCLVVDILASRYGPHRTGGSAGASVRPKDTHFVRLGSFHLFLASCYHFDGGEKEGNAHRLVTRPGQCFVELRDRWQRS